MFWRAAEKAHLVGGNIFDAADDQTESVNDLLQNLVQVSDAKGPYEYVLPTDCELYFFPREAIV